MDPRPVNAPRPLRHRLRLLYQWPAFYFVVVLLGLVEIGWLIPATVILLVASRDTGRRIGRRVISFVFRTYFHITRWCGVLEVDASAVDAIDPDEAMIIAPNHPSGLDALILISRLPRLGCIMKASMLDNVLLGPGARLAGYIRNDGPRRMFRLSTEDLAGGGQLIIFPEATRTLAAPVNPFKGGFVAMAKLAQVPVQTVFIETTTPFLSKGWSVMSKPPELPMRYRVRLGRRFEIGPDADASRAVAEMHAYFVAELADVPLGTLWDRAKPATDDASAETSRPDGDGPRIDPPRILPSLTSSRWG